jgi:peroxiredoxin
MAPELVPVQDWINSRPITLKSLRGKVVLLHFYAFECHNCHANFDHYRQWHKKYGGEVVVLGIQTPETPTERQADAVKQAARERNLEFPILIDLDSANWKAWSNTMWPTVYVIDRDGYLRHLWQGELNWKGAAGDQTIEKLIDELIK